MSTTMRSVEVPAPVRQKLHTVNRRDRWLRFLAGVLAALGGFLAVMMAAMLIDYAFTLFNTPVRWGLTVAALVAGGLMVVLWGVRPLLSVFRIQDVAREVDDAVPELEERWSTVTEISLTDDPPEMRGAPAMIDQVAREAAQMESVVVPEKVSQTRGVWHSAYMLGGISAMLFVAVLADWQQTSVLFQRFWMPAADISVTRVKAVSDDVIVGVGEPLQLQVAVENRPQASAWLFVRYADGNNPEPLELSPSKENSQLFIHDIAAAEESFQYRVRSGDGQTAWHAVTVVPRPQISAIDFRITPPEYSQLPTVVEQGLPRKVRALEGSRLEVAFRTDANLSRFELLLGDERRETLAADADGRYLFSMQLDESVTISPLLTSDYGLTNEEPPLCRIVVYHDRAPRVKVNSPSDEIAVRPDDTVAVEFSAKDDFGITKAELVVYEGHGAEARELKVIDIPLEEQAGAESVDGTAELDLSEFDLKQGAELSYAVRVFDSKETAADSRNYGAAATENLAGDPAEPPETAAKGEQTAAARQTKPADGEAAHPEATAGDETQVASAANPAEESPEKGGENSSSAASRPGESATSKTGETPPNTPGANNAANTASNEQDPSDAKSVEGATSPANGGTSESQPGDTPPSDQTAAAEQQSPRGDTPSGGESSPANSESKPSSSSASGGGKNTPPAAPQDQEQQNAGELASAAKPGDDMARRQLDVGQTSTSRPMRLTIDQWAGSFEGQAREKLQLQIDPFLKQLQEQLAAAENLINPLAAKNADIDWNPEDAEAGGRVDQHLAGGENVILKLRDKTADTPYAFIGLQLVDIGAAHVGPARDELERGLAADNATRSQNLRQSQHHIRRARELLEQLTKKYENVKLNEKLDEELQKVKTMYQFFVENTFEMLKSRRPNLNPKSRKYLEFEMDEEFRKKMQELLDKRQEIMAELAKALADDPRLLRRYMAQAQLQADSLRDQLTLLAQRQLALNEQIVAWKQAEGEQRKVVAESHVRHWHQRLAAEIAEGAATLLDNYVTWIPLDLDIKTGELAKRHEQAASIAATARALSDAVATDKPDDIRTQAESLHQQLKEFENQLPDVMNDHPEHDRLAVHVTNRMNEVKRLITQTSGLVFQSNSVADGSYHLAADVEQNRIGIDTANLAVKLESLEAMLAGMPDDIIHETQDLFLTFDDELLPGLVASQLSLRQNNLPQVVDDQNNVANAFAKAEEQLDRIMDRMIEELDKRPVDTKLGGDLQPGENETLEELLAMLEDEKLALEALGIPRRPDNIHIERDWLMPQNGNGGGGGGMSGMAQGQMAAQRLNQLQQQLRQANLNAKRSRGGGDQSRAARRDRIRWNTLASELEDKLRQGRGRTPPEQYRRAIDEYFKAITSDEAADGDAPSRSRGR